MDFIDFAPNNCSSTSSGRRAPLIVSRSAVQSMNSLEAGSDESSQSDISGNARAGIYPFAQARIWAFSFITELSSGARHHLHSVAGRCAYADTVRISIPDGAFTPGYAIEVFAGLNDCVHRASDRVEASV
jgi:hypothetical protein